MKTGLIPIHLDSLYIRSDIKIEIASPLVDFTGLNDTGKPYLGSTLTAKSLSTLQGKSDLETGVHLHWALPDALTKTMSIPLVYLQSFINVFGTQTGNKLWKILIDEKWLEKKSSKTAKVKLNKEQRKNNIENVSQEQLTTLNELLDNSSFPAVPNRWLLTRFPDGGNNLFKKQWIVESDYVWKKEKEKDQHGRDLVYNYTSYPLKSESSEILDYCFLGRWYPLNNIPAKEDSYLSDPLTAVGYGEPSFAAFYPNCRSVFGFCDSENNNLNGKCSYEVLGWYEDHEQDYLSFFIKDFLENNKDTTHLHIKLLAALKAEFSWFIPIPVSKNDFKDIVYKNKTPWELMLECEWITADAIDPDKWILSTEVLESANTLGIENKETEKSIRDKIDEIVKKSLPERTLCYSRCIADSESNINPAVETKNVTLAIGNTGTEAMSAYIAEQLSKGAKDKNFVKNKIEENLDSLQLASDMEKHQMDLRPKFDEARHENGFIAVPAGSIWSVRSQDSSGGNANAANNGKEISLPPDLAYWLNKLNTFQQEYDKSGFQIKSLQQQIFSDWCSYLDVGLTSEIDDELDPSGQNGNSEPDEIDPSEQNGNIEPDEIDPTPQTNQTSNVSNEKMLAQMDEFIRWEIETGLNQLLKNQKKYEQQIEKTQESLAKCLAEFQKVRQLLVGSDIKDWNLFVKELRENLPKGEAEKLLIDVKLSSSGIPDTDEEIKKLLDRLNDDIIKNPELKFLSFPGSLPETPEVTELLKYRSDPSKWKDTMYYRYNRLMLEANMKQINHKPSYLLQSVSAPRYWQPKEPSLLITGLPPSMKYGQDGCLRDDNLLFCNVTSLDGSLTDNSVYENISDTLENIKNKEPDNFALNLQPVSWDPLFIDWNVDFSNPKGSFSMTGYTTYGYSNRFIKDNFKLELNSTDFSRNDNEFESDSGIPFYSRSILTPSAVSLQRNAVIKNFFPEIMEMLKTIPELQDDNKFTSWNKDKFAEWVKKKFNDDHIFTGIINKKASYKSSDEEYIRDCIVARLSDTSERKLLPLIIIWFWENIKTKANKEKQKIFGDNLISRFIKFADKRINLKKTYYRKFKIPEVEQSDFNLINKYSSDGSENGISWKSWTDWLKKEVGVNTLNDFFIDNNIVAKDAREKSSFLKINFNGLIDWYQKRIKQILHSVLNYSAYKVLYRSDGLSQALGGFNKSLIGLSQTYQLNIACRDEIRNDLRKLVSAAVQNENSYSPLEGGGYSPFRAGKMHIKRVNLINTFGQYWPNTDTNLVEKSKFICTEKMTWEHGKKDIALSPRLVKPARLNFRWLSAENVSMDDTNYDSYQTEMNDHPATSPICGWIMPNNLDNSLMVYDQSGKALGYIDVNGKWLVFPGNDGPLLPIEIENRHLSKMVQRIQRAAFSNKDNELKYVDEFIDVVNSALENIAPADSVRSDSLALMVGKPLALVRAAFSLEQKGLSAVNQRMFYPDLGKFELEKTITSDNKIEAKGFMRTTYDYEKVLIPLRIGEYRQLNDGLIGYWIDSAPGNVFGGVQRDIIDDNTFLAPQSFDQNKGHQKNITHDRIITHDYGEDLFQFNLSLADDNPLELSMLIDPDGKIHATCGLLPVKDLQLPQDVYRKSLENLEVAFLTAPLLTLPERMHISLRNEPDFGWSWVEKDGQKWKTVNSIGTIRYSDVELYFGTEAENVWIALIKIGKKVGNEIITLDSNIQLDAIVKSDFKDLMPVLPKIKEMIEQSRLNPFDTSAAFSGTPEIKEGWLKLTKIIK